MIAGAMHPCSKQWRAHSKKGANASKTAGWLLALHGKT